MESRCPERDGRFESDALRLKRGRFVKSIGILRKRWFVAVGKAPPFAWLDWGKDSRGGWGFSFGLFWFGVTFAAFPEGMRGELQFNRVRQSAAWGKGWPK